jgi:glycosyltransferase involved in cell wall biosynthesis
MRIDAVRVVSQPAAPVATVRKVTVAGRTSRVSVDVIIPMRDAATTILATLASVRMQTYAPRNVFVIDDGSTDGSVELVRAHRIPLVTVVETPHRGVSHARNVGIARSRADFIAFLDSDDLWAEDKLEQQVAVLADNRRASVVTCGSMCFDMQHRPIAGTRYSPQLRGKVFEDTLRQGYVRGGLSSNMLVQRSALLAVGGYDETMAFGEDLDLWLRLARNYTFDYCEAPLAFIVENLHSATRRHTTALRRRETVLQPLCSLEKWLEERASNRWILAFAARLILTYTLRERLTLQGIWGLREAIIERAPELGRQLARTRTHLISAAILAGLVYLPSVWQTWRLRRRRLLARRRAQP